MEPFNGQDRESLIAVGPVVFTHRPEHPSDTLALAASCETPVPGSESERICAARRNSWFSIGDRMKRSDRGPSRIP